MAKGQYGLETQPKNAREPCELICVQTKRQIVQRIRGCAMLQINTQQSLGSNAETMQQKPLLQGYAPRR